MLSEESTQETTLSS